MKIFTFFFVFITTNLLKAQGPLLIYQSFSVENDEYCLSKKVKPKAFVIATPIVVFYKGKYLEPDEIIMGDGDEREISNPIEYKKYRAAEKFISPILKLNSFLYSIYEGRISDSVRINERVLYGCTDIQRFSALIDHYPGDNFLLINNAAIGKKVSKLPKTKLIVQKIYVDNYWAYPNKIGEIDIDGDGLREQIFECPGLGFSYYRVYSYRNNIWQIVYEGTEVGG